MSSCLFTIPKKGKKIVWEITSYCNMNCKHCCSNSFSSCKQDHPNELIYSNQKFINERIDEIISLGINTFYISGGEPFLIKSIFNFLEYLKRKNVEISIASNGYFLNEDFIQRLSKIKIKLLHLSLDGHFSEIHDYLRGGNFFNRIVQNIKKVVKYKIPVRIGCIIWLKNENFLDEMVKLCLNLRVKELRFSWLIKIGRFKNNPNIYPKRKFPSVLKEIEKLKEKYRNKIKITIHRRFKIKNNNVFQVCQAGEKLFFLTPEGKIAPCSWIAKMDSKFTTKKSLKETTFQNLIDAKEMLRFKRMLKKRKNLNLKGCPFIAKHCNGSYYSNDLLH